MEKVFGIGLSRTGTTSFASILKECGIDIIHYPNQKQLFDPENAGACDIPVAAHYKELDAKFPNSKFVYTYREKEDWLISIEKYLARNRNPNITHWQKQHRIILYGQVDFNRDLFSAHYDIHDKGIRKHFEGREKDLLILDICGGDTVESLLSFIGISNKNIPNTFPLEHKRNKHD